MQATADHLSLETCKLLKDCGVESCENKIDAHGFCNKHYKRFRKYGDVSVVKKGGYKEKHGMSRSRIYNIWKLMKSRCDRVKDAHYKEYGGRGIAYDTKWSTFEGFYEDMSDGYHEALTIDRIDNNGNYCKENCRWSTIKQQSNNRRNNRIVAINGVSKTVAEWSDISGINYHTLTWRINNRKTCILIPQSTNE